MTELLTATQMRAIEKAAIESGEVTALELMERAGHGVVDAIFKEWPELAKTSYRAVVLCGPGNNGGDGFVVARLLKEWGWEVEVFLYGNEAKLPPDAKVNCERWREMGEVASLLAFDPWASAPDVAIDALFGTGLTRAMQSDAYDKANDINAIDRVVSIDIPSGYCADSGRSLASKEDDPRRNSGPVSASLTVTFQYQKRGHQLDDCVGNCGALRAVCIGIDHRKSMRLLGKPYDPLTQTKADYSSITSLTSNWPVKAGFSRHRSILSKGWASVSGHKYSHGHALILSGSVGKGGAARLAARGALRVGAGVVTVGCPPSALIENAAQLNAIMLRPMKDVSVLEETLKDERINALCLGPGMGITPKNHALLKAALESKRPMVLDADALSVLFFDEAEALFGKLHDKCVLTPHAGEFKRLFPDIAEKLDAPAIKGPAYSKVDATREAAKRAGCVVLFKGPDTVIADPSGRCSINSAHYERSAPWLATAGSGDVLAGFITGLLARGFRPMQAAETAAWLHVECALSFGPGLIAEDIPEELPKVLRNLKV